MNTKRLNPRMPFYNHPDRDFLLALTGSLIFYTALALMMQVVQPPDRPRDDLKRIPPHIAKLILEAPTQKAQVPGQKAVSLPKPSETPEITEAPKPPPKKDAEEKAKPQQPVLEAPRPPSPDEIRAIQQRNREIAMQSGLLRLLTKEDKNRSSLRDLTKDENLDKVLSPVSGLGALQKPPTQNETNSGKVGQGEGSGGIDDLIALLKDQGGGSSGEGLLGGIGDRRTARVESPIEIKGSGGEDATRSYESIRDAVDSLTGWIRFVYNRALRENPSLKGTITLEFTILASGEVTSCRVVSSTVKDTALEDQLVKRFLQLKFPPVSEGINTVIYPITLIPSG